MSLFKSKLSRIVHQLGLLSNNQSSNQGFLGHRALEVLLYFYIYIVGFKICQHNRSSFFMPYWYNPESRFLSCLNDFYKGWYLTDITLDTEVDGSVDCHKCVQSAGSEQFRFQLKEDSKSVGNIMKVKTNESCLTSDKADLVLKTSWITWTIYILCS